MTTKQLFDKLRTAMRGDGLVSRGTIRDILDLIQGALEVPTGFVNDSAFISHQHEIRNADGNALTSTPVFVGGDPDHPRFFVNGTDAVYTCLSCGRQIKGDVFHDKDGRDVCLPCYREENRWLKNELATANGKLAKMIRDQQSWRNDEG